MAVNTGVYILIIVFLIIVAVVVYYQFMRPNRTSVSPGGIVLPAVAAPDPNVSNGNLFETDMGPTNRLNSIDRNLVCTNDLQCPWGQICSQSGCIPKPCNTDSNCVSGQQCVNKQCKSKKCTTYRDCGKSEACVHINIFDEYDRKGHCMPLANSCTNNSDCHAGTPFCVGGKCQQCQTDNECMDGEVCSNGMCKGHCKHDTDCGNGVGDNSKQCIAKVHHCCPANNQNYGQPCEIHSDCGPNAFCSDKKVCTCVKYQGNHLGGKCSIDSDCQSGKCMTDKRGNKVCGYPNGKCISDSQCPSDKQYCVTGQCSANPVGSTCQTSAKCRKTGDNLFCVDNICQVNPGELNSVCTDTMSCRSPLICAMNNDGITTCQEQKASNMVTNINTATRNGYVPPPANPRRIGGKR